jgi:hypothetical protein
MFINEMRQNSIVLLLSQGINVPEFVDKRKKEWYIHNYGKDIENYKSNENSHTRK